MFGTRREGNAATHTHTGTHTHTHRHMHTHTRTGTYTHTRTHAHKHTHTHRHTHRDIHSHTHARTQAHAHKHTHIHTDSHRTADNMNRVISFIHSGISDSVLNSIKDIFFSHSTELQADRTGMGPDREEYRGYWVYWAAHTAQQGRALVVLGSSYGRK